MLTITPAPLAELSVRTAQLALQHLIHTSQQQLLGPTATPAPPREVPCTWGCGAASGKHHHHHHQQQQQQSHDGQQQHCHRLQQQQLQQQHVNHYPVRHPQQWWQSASRTQASLPQQHQQLPPVFSSDQQQQEVLLHPSVLSAQQLQRPTQPLPWPAQLASWLPTPYCLRQQRAYHPATHTARGITSRILKQRTWQDLRLLFDASGSGARLNPIHLCALLQQLTRLAPSPELLPATERNQLHSFATELVESCLPRLHKFDAVGLASLISSAIKMGCSMSHRAAGPERSSTGGSSGGSSSAEAAPVHLQLLAAASKQVLYADGHSAGVLLAALTSLQQQVLQQQEQQQLQQQPQELLSSPDPQQQQQQLLQGLQQQLLAWQGFTAAMTRRLQACVSLQQLARADASKLCLTVSKLAGVLARQRAAAAASAATLQQQQQQQQQQHGLPLASTAHTVETRRDVDLEPGTSTEGVDGAAAAAAMSQPVPAPSISLQELQAQYSQLQQQLRALLSISAQQVVQGPQSAAAAAQVAPVDSLSDASRVLLALARARAWPGWPAVLGLLQQYTTAFHVMSMHEAAALEASVRAHGTRGRKTQQGPAQGGFGGMPLGFSGAADPDGAATLQSAVRNSPAATIWAVGRLSEQRQQQSLRHTNHHQQWQLQEQQEQQEFLLHEVQQQLQLWQDAGPLLAACQQQLQWFGPMQLAQVATGLGSLVHSSRGLLTAASGSWNTAAGTSTDAKQQPNPQSPPPPLAAAAAAAPAVSPLAEEESTAVAAAALSQHLSSPAVARLLQQHVARVQSLLPLLALHHRLQLAAAYSQLGVVLPQAVSSVFQRDAAQQQQLAAARGQFSAAVLSSS